MAEFLLGVNYWPRASAMAMWRRFDRGEIDEDFARIAELNLRVVRFFLHWEDFMPGPAEIDAKMLDRLEWVVTRLEEHGLLGMPTLFTGHMSGVNWLPEWTLDRSTGSGRFRTITAAGESPYGCGDFYTGELLEAQRRFARAAGARLRGCDTVYAWDLGNEFSNMREPRSPEDAAGWSTALTEDLLATSGRPVTGGTHGEDVTRDRRLRLSSLCKPWEFATMHGYSVYSAFARDRLDPDVVPFLAEIAASCAGKRVLFSEFGNPTCPRGKISPYDIVPLPGDPRVTPPAPPPNAAAFACLAEEEMTVYAHAVLERLHRRGALGAFWWCWADYARSLANSPPFDRAGHELTFGIVRDDGALKPVARTLSAFASEHRTVMEPPAQLVDERAYFAGLPGNVEQIYKSYVARREIPA